MITTDYPVSNTESPMSNERTECPRSFRKMKKALFFRPMPDGAYDPVSLMEYCRDEQLEVEDGGPAPGHDVVKTRLPDVPTLVFVPAIEEDCLAVKLIQEAVNTIRPRIIVLYAPSMPSGATICLAFREGVHDIIALDSDKETLRAQVARAVRMLKDQTKATESGSQFQQKNDSLQRRCEHLERKDARWQERLLALSSAATRMATGRLRLAEEPPCLLVVATSDSQATRSAKLARQLGFDPQVTHSAKEALAQMQKRPPQVILTDGTLADMDAQSFAPAARQALGKKPVVIIAFSSSSQAEETLLACDSGIDDFVLKSTTREGTGLLAAALLGGLR